MTKPTNVCTVFFRCRRGATAVEYALIAVLVSIAIIAGVTLVGGETSSLFTGVGDKVGSATL